MTVRYETYRCKSILIRHKEVDEDWYWVKYSAHPYVCCAFGCHFCYFRAERYLRDIPCEDFDKVIRVKINAPQMLRKQLPRAEKNVIALGDWQPAEKEFLLSRRMLEVVRDLNFPIHIIERSPLLVRDLDILEEINKETWCCVSYSFSTVDKSITKIFEPKAPAPKKRMEAIREISERGILTGLSFMPILPHITDDETHLEETFAMAKEHGAHYVLCATLTMEGQQRDWVMSVIREHYPELASKYEQLYANDAYVPGQKYHKELDARTRRLLKKYGLSPKIPKPVFEDQRKSQRRIDSY
ncbi:MAG: radical SAM protein [Methanomassiliicoccales archaeon]|nr:MAG: radical SAM protein [Methanomassiliicoccales archaeon]